MKSVRRKQPARRRASAKPRKKARPDASVIVIPEGGVETLNAKIGDPFPPMDFRQFLDQPKQEDPVNVDQAFRKIVKEATAQQMQELLNRLGLKPTDAEVYRRAFTILAVALCGVGHVAWAPGPRHSSGRWTPHNSATLFWFVTMLREQQKSLSEQGAIKKIASDEFLRKLLPYQARNLRRTARLSEEERRFQTLRQAWMKIKPQSAQFLAAGRPRLIDAIVGKETGFWEGKLAALDFDHAWSRAGKNRSR